MTPRETRVSIVEAPWRAALNAALWKGQAHQVTTGAASAVTTHCQPGNCRAGTMESAITGMANISATKKRRFIIAALLACPSAPSAEGLLEADFARDSGIFSCRDM